jgi:hypothetical protein
MELPAAVRPSESRGAGSADDERPWGAREASHVRNAVFEAPMRNDPSPHLYVENIFSDAAYDAMLRLFPPDSALRPWDAAADFGSYDRRQEINLPREAQRLPVAQRAFWLDAAAYFLGPGFARTLFERFDEYLRARFGEQLDDPAFMRDRVRGTLILNQHEPGYFLGPHTDRVERILTCLFYFPEHDGLDHLGTTLYRPLEAGFTCNGGVSRALHHDPARFEPRETIPYRPNSVLIFPKSDVFFHGVHPLTAEQLRGSRRRGMQVQFLLQNERPREACRTLLRAVVPGEMQTGSDAAVSVRLTNQAATPLESGFPYQTQLGYRWLDDRGREADSNQRIRTPLPRPLAPGDTLEASMRVVAPRSPGRYVLRLSVVQEGVAWFDDVDPNNGAQAEVVVFAPAAAEPPDDVVANAPDIALGEGWCPVERVDDAVFRWVESEAAVHVAALRAVRHALRVVVEPGPRRGHEPLHLTARLADGRELGAATVSGKQTVTFVLPAESPRVFTVVLSAPGGQEASPNDSRVLNFRVFSISVDRSADVFPPWAVPTTGFYPLERVGNEIFRWVGDEAVVELQPGRADALEFDAESGPGMHSRPFRLRVARSNGDQLVSVEVGSRTRVTVPLRSAEGNDSLRLRAEGGGHRIAGDPRTLNFRVFAAR